MRIYQKTIYEADDGSQWDTEADAAARDARFATIADALRPLGRRPDDPGFANGRGFIRHAPGDILAAKTTLLDLVIADFPGYFDVPGRSLFRASSVGRLLEDAGSPLCPAWSRMMCIDSQGREWGQPYFAAHSENGEAIELPREVSP